MSNLSGGRIVFDCPANAIRYQTKQHLLDHVRTAAEITRGGLAGIAAGVEPLLLERPNV